MAVNGQDIGLLFGVLGGGKINGESGKLIQEQLTSIMQSLNNQTNSKGRRIILNLDIAGTKRNFTEGIRQIVDGLSGQKQFSIKLNVSDINAKSAIEKVRLELQSMMETLSVNAGGLTLTAPTANGEISATATNTKAVKEEGDAAELAAQKTAAYKVQLEALNRVRSQVRTALKTAENSAETEQERTAVAGLRTEYEQLATRVEEFKAKKANGFKSIPDIEAERQEIESYGAELLENAQRLNESANAADVYAQQISRLNTLQKAAQTALGYTSAKGTEQYRAIETVNNELKAMANGYADLDATRLDNLENTLKANTAQIRSMGLASRSLGDIITTNAKKFTSWLSVSQVIMRAFQALRSMVKAIQEVDSAMTELRKVTDETEAAYANFLENTAQRTKALGATLSDTINATADFARLGYNLTDASKLAETAIVYKNVGDGIADISDASESIISTMQAFGVAAQDSMQIVDKFNAVGNNFAISSKGVGDALLRSASAMKAANNTLDETIALVTAANTVVQDADKVGTTMKTLSMFLRAAKTEAEEAGESTEGMANSVSELRGELLALTGGKVDIQVDENTFKSTYQILKEMSAIWGELTDVSQANILEMIGGKRNSNVVAAILNNFSIAEEVLATSANSAGSALEENEKYLESIAGKIAILKATFEDFSNTVIGSDTVKVFVDMGNAVLGLMNQLAKMNLLLPIIVASFVTIRSFQLANKAKETAAEVASLVARLLSEKTANDALITSYQALNAAQKKRVAQNLEEAVTTGKLSTAEYEDIAAKLGLTAATTGAKVATDGLGASIKALLLSNPVGWIIMAISLVPTLISLFGSLHKSTDELLQRAEELKAKSQEFSNEVNSNISTLQGMEEEFETLSRGVDTYGNNISLAADDYDRYREIVSTILGISPSLIEGYNSEGEAIANKNKLLERAIELQEQEYRAELMRVTTASNLKDVLEGSVSNYSDIMGGDALTTETSLQNSIWQLFRINDRDDLPDDMSSGEYLARQIMDALGVENVNEEIEKYINDTGYWQWDWFWDDYVDKIAEDIQSNKSRIKGILDYEDLGYEDNDDLKAAIENTRTAAVEYSEVQGELAQMNADVSDQLQLVAESNEKYADLSNGAKQIVDSFVDSFGVEDITRDGYFGGKVIDEDAITNAKIQINDFIDQITPEIESLVNEGMQLKMGIDVEGNDLTVKEYEKQVRSLLDQIDDLDEDMQVRVRATLDIDADSDTLNTEIDDAIEHAKNLLMAPADNEELKSAFDSYKETLQEVEDLGIDLNKTVYGNIDTSKRQVIEWTDDTLEQYRDALESWGQDIEGLKGSVSTVLGSSEEFDGVEIAFSPMLQTEDGAVLLTSDAVTKYINSLIDIASKDGSWTNEELFALDATGIEQDGMHIKGLLADIGDTAIQTGEAMHYTGDLGAVADAYERLSVAAKNAGVSEKELSNAIKNGTLEDLANVSGMIDDLSLKDIMLAYQITADPNSLTFEQLTRMIEELGVAWDKVVNVWDFSQLNDDVGDLEGKFKNLISAMDSLKDGTALTVGELAKLALEYPELLKVSTLFTDTTVENQQSMLDAILGTYESEYDALLDTKIAELEATNQLMQDQITLENEKKNKVIEIEDLQNNGKLDSEKEYQAILNDLRDLEGQNYVTYSDGVLNVNEDMLNKELEQMGDKVEETKPLFEAQGDMIAEANFKGVTEGLKAFPQYASKLANWAGTSLKTILTNIGTNIKKAVSGEVDSFVGITSGIPSIGSVLQTGSVTLDTQIESGYTIDGKSVDQWSADYQEVIDKRVQTITEQIEANNTIIDNLKRMKGLDLKSIYGSDGSGSKSGSSKSGSSKEVEEYLADIEKYREAIERLNRIQIHRGDLELKLENTDDLHEQIELQTQLLDVYKDEQDAMHVLNDLRDETISNGVTALEQMGFKIEYDPDTNKFFVENLEHINELVADNKGKYDSLQEATNALRKDTEEFINTLEDLNEANQENSESWWENYYQIQETKKAIIDDLKDIVTQASDAVDEIQSVYDTLKSAADEYAENGGFISVDAFQSIVELGPEYMQYLRDENGLLVINEENINKVIAAKTQQLALENAMSYVERLRLALEKDSIEDLNTLLFATTESTNATWGLVYANLALLDLNGEQYEAALHNIDAIRSLADNAIVGIGKTASKTSDTLNDMKEGLDDILKYVMDMLKQRIQNQIDALEDMKDAFAQIIDLKKESLEATKDEEDYQDAVADKIKEIAKLQAQIDALSLDNSRDSQAKRAALMEQMSDLQEELADQQSEYSIEKQKESLDKMQEDYEEEKDQEIAVLEESISSYQKLYDMAIDYIRTHWNTLYDELIAWNTEYGDVLNSEITTAWDNALAAARRYGDYVSALNNIQSDIDAASSSSGGGISNNTVVGQKSDYSKDYNSGYSAKVSDIVDQMRELGRQWAKTTNQSIRDDLHAKAVKLANQLPKLGVTARFENGSGIWWIASDKLNPQFVGQQLLSCYHTGGIAGDAGTLKENELLAKIQRGEVIVSNQDKDSLFSLIDFVSSLKKALDMTDIPKVGMPEVPDQRQTMENITNNQGPSVEFGDVYIYGANDETVEQHREVNRKFVNEVLEKLNIKK